MKENDNTKKFSIKELFTNKQYRSIAILIFYVILFTVLIVAVRSPKTMVNGDDVNNYISNLDGYELINAKNFSYKYTVIVDETTYEYDGKKYDNKDLFTLSNGEKTEEYYIIDDKSYIKNNDKYNPTLSKPIIIFDFFNTNILEQLIIRGIVVDEENHKYKIDNQSLYDVLGTDSVKVDSGNNYITLNYRNSYITGITLDLSNYSKLLGKSYENVTIILEYSDFDLIDDFEVEKVD